MLFGSNGSARMSREARFDTLADAGRVDAAPQFLEERLVRVGRDDARVGQQLREIERLRAGAAADVDQQRSLGQRAHQLQGARGAVAIARTFARQAAVQLEEDAALCSDRSGPTSRCPQFSHVCRNFSGGAAL